MKAYKYSFLEVIENGVCDLEDNIVTYRGMPVQIGDKFVLLLNEEVSIPGLMLMFSKEAKPKYKHRQ